MPGPVSTTSEYGVLGVRDVEFSLERFPPAPELAPLVERHWQVSWELPPGRSGSVTLLPHPCVNLVFDGGVLAITGVGTGRFTYPYRGAGQVFGVKFRPGAFLPFLGRPVAELTDVTLPAERLWGGAATALAAQLAVARSVEGRVTHVQEFLRARRPPPDPQVELVDRIVTALLHDRTIVRVDDVTARFGIGPRTLQRLFRRYVGVSPRWVLRRYRLHEAAAALAGDHDRPLSEVAAELGYFDQSHFIRDFTTAVGLTPAAYARACRTREAPMRVRGADVRELVEAPTHGGGSAVGRCHPAHSRPRRPPTHAFHPSERRPPWRVPERVPAGRLPVVGELSARRADQGSERIMAV